VERKNLSKRLKKQLITRAMKYISTPEGLANVQRILRAKKSADRAMARFHHLLGLPNRNDKRQVDWIIERQNRRLHDLTENLAGVEEALNRLEKTLVPEPPRPAKTVEPQTRPAKSEKPQPATKPAPAQKKPTAPAAKPPAATAKTATKKPRRPAKSPQTAAKKIEPKSPAAQAAAPGKPLGAASQGAKLTGSRNLLDLDFRKKSGKAKKNK